MGYRLNHLDKPVLMALPTPMQTQFGIHYRRVINLLPECSEHYINDRFEVKLHLNLKGLKIGIQ